MPRCPRIYTEYIYFNSEQICLISLYQLCLYRIGLTGCETLQVLADSSGKGDLERSGSRSNHSIHQVRLGRSSQTSR